MRALALFKVVAASHLLVSSPLAVPLVLVSVPRSMLLSAGSPDPQGPGLLVHGTITTAISRGATLLVSALLVLLPLHPSPANLPFLLSPLWRNRMTRRQPSR